MEFEGGGVATIAAYAVTMGLRHILQLVRVESANVELMDLRQQGCVFH